MRKSFVYLRNFSLYTSRNTGQTVLDNRSERGLILAREVSFCVGNLQMSKGSKFIFIVIFFNGQGFFERGKKHEGAIKAFFGLSKLTSKGRQPLEISAIVFFYWDQK